MTAAPKVYLVFEDVMYEGSWLKSVWATREAANAELARLSVSDPGGWYHVEEHEVRSTTPP